MGKRKMNLPAAMEMVPDDLPDGAYWAMVHEIAGADYGEAWDELEQNPQHYDHPRQERKLKCPHCKRKFASEFSIQDHVRSMRKNGDSNHLSGDQS